MKKQLLVLCIFLFPITLIAQFGLKAGVNFANVTNTGSIESDNRKGFHAGVVFGNASKKVFRFKTELLYSKQGYDYKSGTNTGTVDLDYLMSANLTTINITRFFQIHLGLQLAFLLNADADSTNSTGQQGGSQNVMDLFNSVDYGFAGGLEIHPISGLFIGTRVNVSFNSLYKDFENGQPPAFATENLRNNLFQIYTGWKFGKKK